MSTHADLKDQRRQNFEYVFGVTRGELLTHFNGEVTPKEAAEWYRQVRTPCFLFHPLVDLTYTSAWRGVP